MMKKAAIAFAVLLVLLVGAVLAVPFLVDVDKYRPQMVSKANEHINGKLEVGKLTLSLWGQIKVNIDGLNLADAKGQKVVSVQSAYFHVPFASIFSGSPSLILKIDQPMIMAIRDKEGKTNLLSLMKSTPSADASAQPGTPGAPATGGAGPTAVPAMAANARLGIEILQARLTYKDLQEDLSSEFPNMNLVVKDLSLTRTAEIQFWTEINTKMGKTLLVKGPVRLEAKATPKLANHQFEQLQLTAKMDMDDAEISSGTLFHKAKGVAMNGNLVLTASAKEARIEKLQTKFLNAEVQATGVLSNLGAAASPVVQFQAQSNSIDFKPWSDLVPMLKEYDLAGTAKFEASANGPADKLGYKAKFDIDGLSAKGPKLKARPVFNADLSVSTDKVDRFVIGMKSPGNSLEFSGSMTSFTAPKVVAKLTSQGMDLDQLVEFPPPAQPGAPGAVPAAAGAAGGAGAKPIVADYDAMLAPLRENKMMAATDATIDTDIKFVKAYGVKVDALGGKLSFNDLNAALQGFRMRVFDGDIKADFSAALRPTHPTYKFVGAIKGLVIQRAVESQLALFKNTLLGKADFNMSGEGASFNPEPAKANLRAKGSMRIENATFATIDIGKMVTEALNKSIEKVAEKVPAIRGKTIKGIGENGTSRYQLITSDFAINNDSFTAPNFVAKAEANKGIDLNGNTTLGLKDYSVNADWKVIDAYNMTKARDLSVNVGGTEIPHILAKGNEPVQFPVHVGGTLSAPAYTYGQVPEYFAGVALANVTSAATGKAKAAAQKQVDQLIKKAPPAVQNQLQNLGKKLFGR